MKYCDILSYENHQSPVTPIAFNMLSKYAILLMQKSCFFLFDPENCFEMLLKDVSYEEIDVSEEKC